METAISVRRITKTFGQFTAVDDISFEVKQGEIYGFLGPNGSGKTTTIRMMLGLLSPTHGDIEVLGYENGQDARELRNQLGYMSQKFSLYNDLTVNQNLRFYGSSYGLSQEKLEERIQQTIELAGLEGHEKVKTSELSGGWRQRLALGVSILHRPRIVFLDEPTAGVDPVSRRVFWNLLYDLTREGMTVFVTTHYMDEAEHCHRLAFILNGKLITSGTASEIKENTFNGVVLEIFVDDQQSAVEVLNHDLFDETDLQSHVELYGASIHILSEDARIEKRVKNILNAEGIRLVSSQIVSPSLEDVFIAAIRGEGTNTSRSEDQ
jgi:ABC-2 type transport system ATP-binding protein